MGVHSSALAKDSRRSASNRQAPSSRTASSRRQSEDNVFQKSSVPTAKVWRPHSSRSSGQDTREYHAIDSDYVMPTDELEQDRLALQHHMLSYAFGGEVICPSALQLLQQRNIKVLDVGCAKGIWLNAVENKFPDARYFGVDIAQEVLDRATNSDVINYVFGDVTKRLPFPDNTFDFVHQRFMVMGLPKSVMPAVLAELVRVTKPGGWIELVEPDTTQYRTGRIGSVCVSVDQAMTDRGLDVYAGTNLTYHVQRLGQKVSNIGSRAVSIPLNWNGPVGRALALDMRSAILGMEDWMHAVIGKSRAEYREMADQIFDEWGETKAFGNCFCVYFQISPK
ncbi:hypothetical protein HDU83_003212 [Entophlyctis luteolus]|nr:hypothetical protein HDU83_003212 [Entophlyctis luteolus]